MSPDTWSRMPRSNGWAPRRRLAVSLAVLLTVVVVAIILVRTWPDERRTGQSVAQDRLGPVLLVPGYGGGTGALIELADALRSAGRTVVVVRLPGDGTGELTAQAAVLETHVREALAADAPSVDVVGYSAGGVVARIWAQRYDGGAAARRIVTLGSPHHGTTTASAGAASVPGLCPAACRELVPRSPLLASLDVPVPTPPRWLALWTDQDTIVVPPESARLEGAVSTSVQSVCPALQVAHGQLPTNPVVTRFVLDALGPQPLSPPDPRNC